jgi:hypothetical protein
MELKYIVYTDKQSGRISRISYPSHKIDPAGVSEDGKEFVIHVNEDNMPEGCDNLQHFMSYYWYVPSENKFIFIGAAPNRHATWSNELNGWQFDREDLLNDVRIERNRKLSSCDWTQVADSPLSEEQKIEWQSYRQSLRNVINNLGAILSISEVNWPNPPNQ